MDWKYILGTVIHKLDEWHIANIYALLAIIFTIYLLYIIVTGHFESKRKITPIRNFYRQQAARRKWDYHQGLHLPYLTLMDEGKKIKIYEEEDSRYTYRNTNMSRKLEFADKVSISIAPKDSFSLLDRPFGTRDILVGNPEFDDFFMVLGSDEFMVLTFLSPDIQEHILRLKDKEPNVNISQNGIRITIYSHLRSDRSFDEFVETGLAIISKAKSLCRKMVWD